LAIGERGGTLKIWDATSRQELASLFGHSNTVRSVAFSPRGDLLASASGREAREGAPLEPGEVKVWDLSRHVEIATLPGLSNAVRALAFSPDGQTLAVAAPYAAELWNLNHPGESVMLAGAPKAVGQRVTALAFSPHGRTLAVASYAQNIEIWDVRAHRQTRELVGSRAGFECVSFSHDGRLLAGGSPDLSVWLWEAGTGKLLKTFQAHKALSVNCLAFSSDDRTLATGGGDGMVRLWSVAVQRELAALESDANKGSCGRVLEGRTISFRRERRRHH
jgi:WD40 repeat protein